MTPLSLAADHPAYAGHFPGRPILPGAVLLDFALQELQRQRGLDLTQWRLTTAKFPAMVQPGDELTLEFSAPDAGTLRFAVRRSADAVLTGGLSRAGTPSTHGA